MDRSGIGGESRWRPRRLLERHSMERVGTLILEYLVYRKEHPEPRFEVGVSPYAIMRGARDLNTQKQDRVEYLLGLFEKNGLVTAKSSQQGKYYEITEKGVDFYKKNAKAFYAVFSIYKEPEL